MKPRRAGLQRKGHDTAILPPSTPGIGEGSSSNAAKAISAECHGMQVMGCLSTAERQ